MPRGNPWGEGSEVASIGRVASRMVAVGGEGNWRGRSCVTCAGVVGDTGQVLEGASASSTTHRRKLSVCWTWDLN